MTTTTAAASDLDTLTALNRDYIDSVQRGNVGRFEQILAEDFVCSHPDGSLVDRARFLEQTARPVTISKLEATTNAGDATSDHPRAHDSAGRPPRPGATPTCGRRDAAALRSAHDAAWAAPATAAKAS
jgi:hypothetical protein